jgi:hypothetical protein
LLLPIRRARSIIGAWRVAPMKHYRINKVAEPGGHTLKAKDILASNDEQAVARAEGDDDCPVCEVYRAGQKVGAVLENDTNRAE